MEQEPNQLTLSILPSMKADLDSVKAAYYPDSSSSDMLRDLILRGLAASRSGVSSVETRKEHPSWETFTSLF